MKKPNAAWIMLVSVALGLGLLAGCQGGVTPIKTLLDDPGRFDKQVVRISGTVGHSIGVLGYGAYRIDDGTGSLVVLTKERGAPREGARVGVEGEFRAAYTLGTDSAAALMEKQRFTP